MVARTACHPQNRLNRGIVRITEGTENTENTEKRHPYENDLDIPKTPSAFLCAIREIRDSDNNSANSGSDKTELIKINHNILILCTLLYLKICP